MEYLLNQNKKIISRKISQLENQKPPNPLSVSSCINHIKHKWSEGNSISALWKDWPEIAGEQLSSNCSPLTFQGGILTLGANHPQWVQALIFNKTQLLASLRTAGHVIKEIRIKQQYPRKYNQLETEQSIWKKHPSRADIYGKKECPMCNSPSPVGEISLWGKCGLCRREDLSNKKL